MGYIEAAGLARPEVDLELHKRLPLQPQLSSALCSLAAVICFKLLQQERRLWEPLDGGHRHKAGTVNIIIVAVLKEPFEHAHGPLTPGTKPEQCLRGESSEISYATDYHVSQL